MPFLLAVATIFLMIPMMGIGETNASQGPSIAVKPNYTKNQIKQDGVIFVQTKPGQTQQISLNIVNLSKSSQSFSIEPTTAFTSGGGAIALNPTKNLPVDKTLKYKFKDLVQDGKKQTINLGPNKSTNVNFNVKAPDKTYNGVILGGLYIKPQLPPEAAKLKGVSVNNKFALAMPVYLRDNNNQPIKPKLTAQTIKPGKVANQPVIYTKLANEKPTTINQMQIKDKIYRKSDPSKILSKSNQNGLSMAPNSNFNFTNQFGKNALLPGNYHLSLKASDNNGNKWTIEKDFHITITQAAINNANKNWWWIILLIILLILILILCYVLYRQHRKQKNLIAQQQAELDKRNDQPK